MIQYNDPHPAGRDRRGVLLFSLHDAPSMSWKEIMQNLNKVCVALNPNVVRFPMPNHLGRSYWKRAQAQLEESFCKAFPDKQPAKVRFFENAQGHRNIDIGTPYDNVKAVDIIAAAMEQKWKAGLTLLGAPLFVGFPCKEMLFPVKLGEIPHALLDSFIAEMPEFFAQFNEPSVKVRVVDVWEMQAKVTMKHRLTDEEKTTTWFYANSIVAVIEFMTPLPGKGRIYDLVHDWPGWAVWKNKVNVYMHFPGRFDYCGLCKFHAQEVEEVGEEQRHLLSECQKLICAKCGEKGRFDSHCKIIGAFSQYRKRDDWPHRSHDVLGGPGASKEESLESAREQTQESNGKGKARSMYPHGQADYWDTFSRQALDSVKASNTRALSNDEGKGLQGKVTKLNDGDQAEDSQDESEEWQEASEEIEIPGTFPTPEQRITF